MICWRIKETERKLMERKPRQPGKLQVGVWDVGQGREDFKS